MTQRWSEMLHESGSTHAMRNLCGCVEMAVRGRASPGEGSNCYAKTYPLKLWEEFFFSSAQSLYVAEL